MREIGLFKGFNENPNGKQIITLDGVDIRGEWICGGYWFSEGRHWIAVDDRTKTNEIGSGSNCVLFKTVCEYTGLTDKNGKRIWENDLCISNLQENNGGAEKGEKVVHKVVYENGAWVSDYYGWSIFYKEEHLKPQVIGDIFNTRSVE